jgi:hypothetical protein
VVISRAEGSDEKMAKREKYYAVVSADKKYTYGAFKFTPEGEKDAKSYIRKLRNRQGGDFLILEK